MRYLTLEEILELYQRIEEFIEWLRKHIAVKQSFQE